MSAEIIPFDFEEQAVRIIMQDDEPWFIAADVCRVLELGNTSQALTRLDEDEKGVTTNDTLGGAQRMSIINESGLYALVLTSRKEQAKRFRKWITSEVLPAIRRTGRYEHPGIPANDTSGDIAGLPIREAELWLQMVREARLTRGTGAAAAIWGQSPLPPLRGNRTVQNDPAEGRACLAHLLGQLDGDLGSLDDRAFGSGDIALARQGIRVLGAGLFVANSPLTLFAGSRWGGGGQRAALLTLPGAAPGGPRTLAGTVARGVLVPWAHIDGGAI